MIQTTVRKASASDIHVIRKVAEVAFRETYKEILSATQIDYMMEWMYSVASLKKQFGDHHRFFVAYQNEDAIGYISISPEGKHLFHLQKIYVLPAFHKQGIGRLLMDSGLAYIHSVHPEPCMVELNVNRNNPAVGFYQKMGWRVVREGDFPIGNGYFMNDFIMGKDL